MKTFNEWLETQEYNEGYFGNLAKSALLGLSLGAGGLSATGQGYQTKTIPPLNANLALNVNKDAANSLLKRLNGYLENDKNFLSDSIQRSYEMDGSKINMDGYKLILRRLPPNMSPRGQLSIKDGYKTKAMLIAGQQPVYTVSNANFIIFVFGNY